MRFFVVLFLLTVAFAGCSGGGDDEAPDSETDELADSFSGFSDTHVFPGEYDTAGSFAKVATPGPHAMLEPVEHRLQSVVDGADIQIYVQRPDVADHTLVPVVAMASPYYAGWDWDGTPRLSRFAENLVPHGYAMAYIAVRGTSDSGGCNDFFGTAEASDVDQAVTWLGEQDWSSGAVGMIGLSYGGITAWEVAATGNPYVKTIVPVEGLPDLFELFWGNGTWKTASAPGLLAAYYQSGTADGPDSGRSGSHIADAAVCPGLTEGLSASLAATATAEPDPLGYWAERDYRERILENYNGSVFVVHGLQDWLVNPGTMYPFASHLEQGGVVVKHLLGQWGHTWPDSTSDKAPYPRWDWAEMLLHWFDFWLKGEQVDLGPRVQVQDNELQWRSTDAWPPKEAAAVTYYLAPGGSLEPHRPDQTQSILATTNVVVPDPEHLDENTTVQYWTHPLISLCPECPTFSTEPLEEDLRFAGLPRVPVTVTPHGPGGQLTAYLYAVHPDGDQERLGWGAIDLRFADGTRTPHPVQPDTPLLVRLQLEPLDVVVREGSRLVLQLHQGGEGDHNSPAKTPFPMEIEVGGDQSRLMLDIIEPDPTVFFDPPGAPP